MQLRNPHNTFKIPLNASDSSPLITISSEFDSGNLQSAMLTSRGLIVQPSLDPFNPSCSLKPSTKTFFHFLIECSVDICLTIIVRRMNVLRYFGEDYSNFEQYYRICVADEDLSIPRVYRKMKLDNMKINNENEECELQFKYKLEGGCRRYLAFHFPYPLFRLQNLLHLLKESPREEVYYRCQLLIESVEGRPVHLLTITGRNGITEQQQGRISKSLFPFYDLEGRPPKFQKPYILLTSRVHPGETSASFALEGILEWLMGVQHSTPFQMLGKAHSQLKVLLRNFVFLIVPIVNPDGAFNGFYRMDSQGHNLNRFYNSAQSHRQPSIFAIQALLAAYCQRLVFYCDMHSHPHFGKGSFIYGNSYHNIHEQVQSQLYAKILADNSKCFQYSKSNFSPFQMASKDVNEIMGKDGCGRVYVYRSTNLINCYTMEMGYHGSPFSQTDTTKTYSRSDCVFEVQDYKNHGVSMLVSLFDFYSAIYAQDNSKIKLIRQQIVKEIYEKEERFKLTDQSIGKKMKNIDKIINQQIYQKLTKAFPQFPHSIRKNLDLIRFSERARKKDNSYYNIQKTSYQRKIKEFQEDGGFKNDLESPQDDILDSLAIYNYHSENNNNSNSNSNNKQQPISKVQSSFNQHHVNSKISQPHPFSAVRGRRIFYQRVYPIYEQKFPQQVEYRAPNTYHSDRHPENLRQQTQEHLLFNFDPLRSHKAIKMVKLDFNPFPKFERKGLYNIITGKKSSETKHFRRSEQKHQNKPNIQNAQSRHLHSNTPFQPSITSSSPIHKQHFKAVHIQKFNIESQFLMNLKPQQFNFVNHLSKTNNQDKTNPQNKRANSQKFPKIKMPKESYLIQKQRKYKIQLEIHKKYQKQYGVNSELRESKTRINARNQIFNVIGK